MDESRFFEFEIQHGGGGRFACVAPSLDAARRAARGFGLHRLLLRGERDLVARESDEASARAALEDPLLGKAWIGALVRLVSALDELLAAPQDSLWAWPRATDLDVVDSWCACASRRRGEAGCDLGACDGPPSDVTVEVVATGDGGWRVSLGFVLDLPGTSRRMELARALGWHDADPAATCEQHVDAVLIASEPAGTSAFAVAHRLLIALRFVADLRAHDDLACVLVEGRCRRHGHALRVGRSAMRASS